MAIGYPDFKRRATLATVALTVMFALVATACGEPAVPIAASSSTALATATAVPVPETPTPVPTPTLEPATGADGPVPTPTPVVQPGLSSDLIRVAVIFDSETAGAADGLFHDAFLGALAWEREVNENGGLGGRFVEVVPLDSRLFDHRSALEEVCQGDFFAIIGSHSLGDFEGAELLGTEDCNIADFPGQVYGARRAASPVTFLSNPFLNDARQAGPARYLVEKYPEASQNLGLFYYIALDLQNTAERQREMLEREGMNVVFDLAADLEEDPSERILNRWAELGAESLVWTADPGRLIELLNAFDEPLVVSDDDTPDDPNADATEGQTIERPTFVLCEWGCYSEQFLLDGGDAIEGVYTWIPHSPFDSPNAPREFLLYRFMMDRVATDAGWSEISLQSWQAGRLFEAAYNTLISIEPEAPTRSQLIDVARATDNYTANNVLSFTGPGRGEPTPCFVLMVVQNGRWVQEHPQPPRDKDCDEENISELLGTRNLGVTAISATDSEEFAASDDGQPRDLDNPEELEE